MLFSVMSSARTRGSRHKLRHMRFFLNTRKHFIVHVMEHWNRLPSEVMESPFLKIFKSLGPRQPALTAPGV